MAYIAVISWIKIRVPGVKRVELPWQTFSAINCPGEYVVNSAWDPNLNMAQYGSENLIMFTKP